MFTSLSRYLLFKARTWFAMSVTNFHYSFWDVILLRTLIDIPRKKGDEAS